MHAAASLSIERSVIGTCMHVIGDALSVWINRKFAKVLISGQTWWYLCCPQQYATLCTFISTFRVLFEWSYEFEQNRSFWWELTVELYSQQSRTVLTTKSVQGTCAKSEAALDMLLRWYNQPQLLCNLPLLQTTLFRLLGCCLGNKWK